MLGKRRNGPKSVLACNRCRVLKIKCINVALVRSIGSCAAWLRCWLRLTLLGTSPAQKDVQESSLSGPPPIPDIPCDACQSATAPCSYELTAYQSKRRVVDLDSPPPDGLSSPRPRFADDHHNTVYAAPLARMPVVNKAETATVRLGGQYRKVGMGITRGFCPRLCLLSRRCLQPCCDSGFYYFCVLCAAP